MRDELVKYVQAATEEVFATALDLRLQVGEVMEETEPPTARDGVVALVGLVGPWVGVGALTCAPEMACRVSERLLLTEFPSVTEEVLDAVGELANMVIGNFKTHLEERAGPIGLSIPTVIYGKNFMTRSPNDGSWLRVPFSCELGDFDVRLCLRPGSGQARLLARLAVVEEAGD